MTKQGTVNVEDLNGPQLKFTIDAMAMVMDKLIQDEMQLNEDGTPVLAEMQENLLVRQAMQILNYK